MWVTRSQEIVVSTCHSLWLYFPCPKHYSTCLQMRQLQDTLLMSVLFLDQQFFEILWSKLSFKGRVDLSGSPAKGWPGKSSAPIYTVLQSIFHKIQSTLNFALFCTSHCSKGRSKRFAWSAPYSSVECTPRQCGVIPA